VLHAGPRRPRPDRWEVVGALVGLRLLAGRINPCCAITRGEVVAGSSLRDARRADAGGLSLAFAQVVQNRQTMRSLQFALGRSRTWRPSSM
jgi:hypothetical protein